MSFLVVKWLHLLGAAVLLGTGMGIAFFAWFGYRMALRDNNLGLLRGVLVLTVRADALFTALAAIAQPLTGMALWWMTGGTWPSRWLAWVLAAYIFVGICWLPVVVLQIRLRNAALAAPSIDQLGAQFHARFRLWFLLGLPAFATMLVLYALMLLRHHIP